MKVIVIKDNEGDIQGVVEVPKGWTPERAFKAYCKQEAKALNEILEDEDDKVNAEDLAEDVFYDDYTTEKVAK